MVDTHHNFGTASVKVEILSALPYINTKPVRMNFDVNARMYPSFENSPNLSPLLTEAAIDPTETFAAIFPAKRIRYVDNYLKNGSAIKLAEAQMVDTIQNPYIGWVPVNNLPAKTAFSELKKVYSDAIYDPAIETSIANGGVPDNYNGPIWNDVAYEYTPPTNDMKTIGNYFEYLTGKKNEVVDEKVDSDILPLQNRISQMRVLDGLWWGVESDSFITSQMPFWVIIDKQQAPTTSDKETLFIISIGSDDANNRYDIYLSADNAPRLIDYTKVNNDILWVDKKWENDLSRVIKNESHLEIGIMTAAGRLIVFVNKIAMIYTRINRTSGDNAGKFEECLISPGKIRVYGTNVQATICACPMSFSPLAAFSLNIPSTDQFTDDNAAVGIWKGVDINGEPKNSVAELPLGAAAKHINFGVDCSTFSGDGGECSPTGIGYHSLGNITFKAASGLGLTSLKNVDFYLLIMSSENGTMTSSSGTPYVVPYGGCPYFYRLKGIITDDSKSPSPSITDISTYVESISENINTSDYYQVKRTATVTCYNENGVLNGLLTGQKGIRIYWGWNGENKLSFTGIVTSYNLSEKAGKETITLNCSDYSFILSNSPIINSPFYDGMLATKAIIDLAKRGGCINPVDVGGSNEFLPSAFNYNDPAVRFREEDNIDTCMTGIAKRFTHVFYFDENGVFHVKKMEGGLFSNFTVSSGDFSQDPSSAKKQCVILDEKNVTVDLNSTVNVISLFSVDRDTRNLIVVTHTSDNDKILFKRTFLNNQPALGDIETTRAMAREQGLRLFFPILKTSFKTVGEVDTQLQVLDFITVCGKPFRLMSIKRDFNAANNDFSQSYEAEWVGGKN